MAIVEWDDIEQPKKGFGSGKKTGSGKYMRLGPNEKYTVRPVLRPICFYKYFNRHNGQLRSAITEDPNTCPVRSKFPDLSAQLRYACLVIDREDSKLKILEGPQSLFNHFRNYKKMAKKDPGGPEGGDFIISVICPNGKKDRDTTYDVDFVETVPFTEEEKNFVRENKEDFNIEEIFKAMEPEAIERILFGDNNDSSNSNDSGSTSSTASNAMEKTTAATTSSDDDDPFNFA